jgi:hypothetical protein
MKSRQSCIDEKACLWVFKFAFLSPLWYFGCHCKKLQRARVFFFVWTCLLVCGSMGAFCQFIFYLIFFAFVSPFLCDDEWWPQAAQYPQIQKTKEKREIQFIATTKSRGPTQYETKTWSKNSHTPCQHGPLYLGACKLKQVWQLRIAYHMWHESAQQLFQNKAKQLCNFLSRPLSSCALQG